MRTKLEEIAAAVEGRILWGDGGREVTHFITDSREAGPGAMFVPIRGERTDGHTYIASVFEKGAAAAFTDHEIPFPGGPVVLVEDCRGALQRYAACYRSQFDLPIVGITGSVGKTTTKEMLAQTLSAGFDVMKTAGSQNSQVGVPITICGLAPRHTAAVVEMGMSMPGEMGRIAPVVRPTCAVITNIGVSHIEFCKTRENILKEKMHIADYLPYTGALFVNGDDDLLSALEDTAACRVIPYGLGEDCYWQAQDLREENGGTRFTCLSPQGWEQEVFVPAPGVHNVRNALACMAVACHLGMAGEAAAQAIADYTPPAMRQQILQAGGVTVIDDSYNASPDSMRGALDVLCSRPCEGRRFAVLADMLELGEVSRQAHLEVGQYAREKGIHELVAVGPLAKDIAQGFGDGARWFPSNGEALGFLKGALGAGDAVLVKGSRGMHTDEIVKALCKGSQQGK